MRTFLKTLGRCFLVAGVAGISTWGFPAVAAEELYPITQLSAEVIFIAEPFDGGMLDEMEQLLSGNLQPGHKAQLAAILYRYGRKSGEEFLARALLEERDVTAAAVFALNRDETKLDAVLGALAQLKPTPKYGYSRYDAELVRALGKWNHPRVVAALLAKQKAQPHNGEVALALARRNVKAAVPLLTRACAGAKWDSLETLKLKAALANLTPETPRRFVELMRLKQNPRLQTPGLNPEFMHQMALVHLAYAQDLRLVRVLIREIENYRAPAQVEAAWLEPVSPAAELLVQYPSGLTDSTLRKLFDRLKLSKEATYHPFSAKWRVAGYLYNAQPQADHAFLKEALGQDAVAELKVLHQLRPIPQHLLAFDPALAERF